MSTGDSVRIGAIASTDVVPALTAGTRTATLFPGAAIEPLDVNMAWHLQHVPNAAEVFHSLSDAEKQMVWTVIDMFEGEYHIEAAEEGYAVLESLRSKGIVTRTFRTNKFRPNAFVYKLGVDTAETEQAPDTSILAGNRAALLADHIDALSASRNWKPGAGAVSPIPAIQSTGKALFAAMQNASRAEHDVVSAALRSAKMEHHEAKLGEINAFLNPSQMGVRVEVPAATTGSRRAAATAAVETALSTVRPSAAPIAPIAIQSSRSGMISMEEALSTLPAGRHLTPDEKADMYGDLIMWNDLGIDGRGFPVLGPISPISGEEYVVRYNEKAGEYGCNCCEVKTGKIGQRRRSGARCYHLITFEREWLPLIAPLMAAWSALRAKLDRDAVPAGRSTRADSSFSTAPAPRKNGGVCIHCSGTGRVDKTRYYCRECNGSGKGPMPTEKAFHFRTLPGRHLEEVAL